MSKLARLTTITALFLLGCDDQRVCSNVAHERIEPRASCGTDSECEGISHGNPLPSKELSKNDY